MIALRQGELCDARIREAILIVAYFNMLCVHTFKYYLH